MLQLHLSEQQFYCLPRFILYDRFDGSLTLYVLNLSYETRRYIHTNSLLQDCSISSALAMEILQSCTKPSIYSHLSTFRWCYIVVLLHGRQDMFILHDQYHGCWWPGDPKSQGITSHGNDIILWELSSFSTTRVNYNCNQTMFIDVDHMRRVLSHIYINNFWLCKI